MTPLIPLKIGWMILAASGLACLFMNHNLVPVVGAAGLCIGAAMTMFVTAGPRPQENALAEEDLPRMPARDNRRKRVLIIGAGAVGRQLADRLEADLSCEVMGFVDDHISPDDADGRPVLGRRDATAAIVQEYGIQEVYLAHAPTWQQTLAEELTAECPDVAISVVPSPYEAMLRTGKIRHCGDIALARLHYAGDRSTDTVKRVFDLTISLAVLLLAAPFMLLTALLIRLTSPGPILFAQERVGRYGRTFMLYKFRTMVQDAEARSGPVLSSGIADSRLTRLGRWLRLFRIDELPQLWNVLRGEMSLVGPRPERPYFVDKFECLVPSYARRHQVRPGITGLAQVCGGYHTDARDKLRFDLIYITHQSLWMDLYVLFRTVLVVVMPDGR